MATTGKISAKRYQCSHCGHEEMQSTNHYGQTYSWGQVNRCPECGWKRPMETTVWNCIEPLPEGMERPADWQQVKIDIGKKGTDKL